jgi:subtilisin family serine protease
MILPTVLDTGQPAPGLVFGYLSARSQGGTSITEATLTETTSTDALSAEPYRATEADLDAARSAAADAGLTVTAASRLGLAVAGPPQAYESLTGGRVVTQEVLQHTTMGRQSYVTHLDIQGDDQPEALGVAASRADSVEAVILERPRMPHAIFPSPLPPTVSKFHLSVPGDVAAVLGAERAHVAGDVGSGTVVAMVDTGQYSHPFFVLRGYDVAATVALVPGTNPAKDPVGHGTGESANVFAVAPGATLRPYRASDNAGRLVAAIGGFLQAKADQPQVITNSWGGDLEFPPTGPLPADYQAWVAEIVDAIEQNIVVVFSAGNGHFSVEPQVPGVIAAGGVFSPAGLGLTASNYASGYASPWFAGTTVPTVCGLVGLLPRAQYLMLPVPPQCSIDVAESQPLRQQGVNDTPDGTLSDDGWALFSGTSAAAPQVAGAVAVLLAAHPGLTPAQVTEALAATAVDVSAGSCHPRFGNLARPGPDEATGAGLVDVSAALAHVRANF